MNISEHKEHLLKRFSTDECIELISNTIDIWKYKRKIQLENNGSTVKCDRSLIYFKKLRNELMNNFYCHDELISNAEETGDFINRCKNQCLECKK